jgi:hypothetical protein
MGGDESQDVERGRIVRTRGEIAVDRVERVLGGLLSVGARLLKLVTGIADRLGQVVKLGADVIQLRMSWSASCSSSVLDEPRVTRPYG